MSNIAEKEINIIKGIILKYIPDAEVRIFGSRVKGTNSESSDIDIAIISKDKINFSTLGKIKIDFEESELPYRVDIIDYNSIDENFKKIIDSNSITL